MEDVLNINVRDFYNWNMFDESVLNHIQKHNKELDFSMLFLMRIFWKILKDCDVDNKGYEVDSWGSEEYYQFLIKNLENVNLNQDCYRNYFKSLVKYVINDLSLKIED